MKCFFSRLLTVVCLFGIACAPLRADEEQDLIGLLRSDAAVTAKCDACLRLRVIGTSQCVPALAQLLGEERLAQAARHVLEGLPGPEAGAALRNALTQTRGLAKVGVIDSLGRRRDAESVAALTAVLADTDPTLVAATATALGRIGGSAVRQALERVRDTTSGAVQMAVLEGLLRCAEQFLSVGDSADASAIYQDLFRAAYPAAVRAAAWRGLALSATSQRTEMVTRALSGADPLAQGAALRLLRELNDAPLVKVCQAQWTSLPELSQLAVLDAQLRLGVDAPSAVRAATESQHLSVRISGWRAVGELGDPAALPALVRAAARGEGAEREAAREALACVRGPGARGAFLSLLTQAEASEKAELLRALGERGDKESTDVLLRHATAESEAVRLAAVDSLKKLAPAEALQPLLDLTAQSASEDRREPLRQALLAVWQALPDRGARAAGVVEAIGRYPSAQRQHLLPLLAEIGSSEALQAGLGAARDPDSELAKEAIQVLGQWPSAAPAVALLDLARGSTDATLHMFAVQACIDVVAQDQDVAHRLETLRKATSVARRADEKRRALGQVGQIPTAEALQFALSSLVEAELVNEAGAAAVSVAEKLAAANPELAEQAAIKVLERCKTADVVKRAWALRRKSAEGATFIQDWKVSGPYRQTGVTGAQAVFELAFAPEKPNSQVEWKALPRAEMLNLSAVFPDQADCVAYLKTTIIAPAATPATLLLGSDDGVKAWVNGEVVHSHNVDRGAVVDQDAALIQLTPGPNRLLLKVSQGGGGWAVCARIVGTDGKALTGLRFEVGE